MRKRTKAREYALQMLYQADVAKSERGSMIVEFWAYHIVPPDVKTFATRLVEGTLSHVEEIDRLIAAYANNWEIARMAVVDRNILRLGAFELLHLFEEVPPKVCLNEAVELAKRFGDEESSKFVNGILDTIHKTRLPSGQAAADAEPSPSGPSGKPRRDNSPPAA
ncbi:MAG: transcription antitermination factor NusB [Candidatus Omnitrophica bacterium]|nr:transcription antitermination factor NusB [Candidatus Omnitrophota bacterium]